MTNTMTTQQQIDIAEHEQELGCKLRIMSYDEFIIEEDINDDADSKAVYDSIRLNTPLCLSVIV